MLVGYCANFAMSSRCSTPLLGFAMLCVWRRPLLFVYSFPCMLCPSLLTSRSASHIIFKCQAQSIGL